MPLLDLNAEKPVSGALADATQIAAGFTEVMAVVNALDATNWASGQLFAPSKITQEGASTGNFLRWNGTIWIPASISESDLPGNIAVTKLAPGVDTEVLTTVSGVPAWAAPSGGGGGGGDPVPVAVVFFTADSTAPAGYLLCDGTAVSRATYSALFSAIGTDYGVGDGSTTFNLPNLKGRMPVGLDSGQTEFDALGETGGAKTVTLDSTMIPAHTHSDGSFAVASHSHSTGTLAVSSHSHTADGTLAAVTHHHQIGAHSHTLPMNVVSAPTPSSGGTVRDFFYNTTTAFNTGTQSAYDTADTAPDVSGNTSSTQPTLSGTTGSASPDVSGTSGSTGGGAAHQNLPPYIILNGIIKT